jgi:hypothetical protein
LELTYVLGYRVPPLRGWNLVDFAPPLLRKFGLTARLKGAPFPLIVNSITAFSVTRSGQGYNLRALEVAVGNAEGPREYPSSLRCKGDAYGAIGSRGKRTYAGVRLGEISGSSNCSDIQRNGGGIGDREFDWIAGATDLLRGERQ